MIRRRIVPLALIALALSASLTACGSKKDVTTTTGTSRRAGSSAHRASTSMPSTFGIWRSRNARSGGEASADARPSAPSAVSTTRSATPWSIPRSTRRNASSSSMTSTVPTVGLVISSDVRVVASDDAHCSGSCTVNVLPRPTSLSSVSVPASASDTRRA